MPNFTRAGGKSKTAKLKPYIQLNSVFINKHRQTTRRQRRSLQPQVKDMNLALKDILNGKHDETAGRRSQLEINRSLRKTQQEIHSYFHQGQMPGAKKARPRSQVKFDEVVATGNQEQTVSTGQVSKDENNERLTWSGMLHISQKSRNIEGEE